MPWTTSAFTIFASISAKIGGITSYGGLGVIGAIPVIHSMIAILMVVLVVGTFREKNWDVWAIWDDTEAGWKTAGRLAEIVLRVATLTLGSAPILIPILGIISQYIGLYYSVKDTKDAMTVEKEFYEDEMITVDLHGPEYSREIAKKYGAIGHRYVYTPGQTTIVRKVFHVHSRASEYTRKISKMIARIIQVASETFASIKGLDSFTKFSVAICGIVAPQRKELIATMKNFRLVSAPRNILTVFNGPLLDCKEEEVMHDEGDPSDKWFWMKCSWRNTVRKVTGYGTFIFLTMGYAADCAKFVTKSNIANLAGYANDLGKFKIFGFLGTVSFNTIKASSMFVVLILELGRIAVDFDWDKIKKNQTLQIELLIKVSLATGKIVAIFISGGFMFYAGWGAASAASNIIQAIVFGADFAYWVKKESIDKPKTEHWGLPDDGEANLIITSQQQEKESKKKEDSQSSLLENEGIVDMD